MLWFTSFSLLTLILIGIGIILVCFLLGCLYLLPYYIWLAGQNNDGKCQEQIHTSARLDFKHAYKLYKSWITRRPAA